MTALEHLKSLEEECNNAGSCWQCELYKRHGARICGLLKSEIGENKQRALVDIGEKEHAGTGTDTASKIGLSDISTKQLTEELKKREGITLIDIEPSVDAKIYVSGLATVFIVTD